MWHRLVLYLFSHELIFEFGQVKKNWALLIARLLGNNIVRILLLQLKLARTPFVPAIGTCSNLSNVNEFKVFVHQTKNDLQFYLEFFRFCHCHLQEEIRLPCAAKTKCWIKSVFSKCRCGKQCHLDLWRAFRNIASLKFPSMKTLILESFLRLLTAML